MTKPTRGIEARLDMAYANGVQACLQRLYAAGAVHTSPGPLSVYSQGTLHATVLPPKWKGNRCILRLTP